jgi:hypothetical protein
MSSGTGPSKSWLIDGMLPLKIPPLARTGRDRGRHCRARRALLDPALEVADRIGVGGRRAAVVREHDVRGTGGVDQQVGVLPCPEHDRGQRTGVTLAPKLVLPA